MRHTTPDVPRGLCYGRSDVALTGDFAVEAQAALARLPAVGRVVTSPLTRCLRLAEHISTTRRVPVTVDNRLTEMDFGAWEGRSWSDLPRQDLDAWAADFHGYRGHGGESVAALFARVSEALDRIGPDAVVVTHMGVIKAALARVERPGAWDYQMPFGEMVDLRGAL